MIDLAARVLAAIEETEKIAQAAVGKLTGSWAVEPFEPSRPEAVPASAWVDDGDEGIAMVNGGYRAAHIAHHDPAATLRRCEADRRTVTRHEVHDAVSYRKCTDCSEDWPCPDLLDRAAAYDVTTEETAPPARTCCSCKPGGPCLYDGRPEGCGRPTTEETTA